MDLATAAAIALQHSKAFARRNDYMRGLTIVPTDGVDCCIVYMKGERIASRWNPQASDLIADDYLLVEGPNE